MYNGDDESVALLESTSLVTAEEKVPYAARSQSTFKLSQWVIILLFALTAIDIAVSLYIAQLLLSTRDPKLDTLQIRSQYVGLDELYASGLVNASRHPPIINMPRVAAQISRSTPHEVFSGDQHRHLTEFGTLSPPDRHFQVSDETHTVLQFRVMDYGMERCSLALRLPSSGDSLSAAGNDSATTRLEVCMLDATRLLDARKLSWSNRPRCVKLMGTITTYDGIFTRLPEFACSWGSLYAYEVACTSDSPQCDIDVWSGKNSPYGMFMYQFQTV